MSATAFVETDAFRNDLEAVFVKADAEAKTGLGFEEVSEWLIEDAPDFLLPEDGQKLDEATIIAFVRETMDSMVATVIPDQMKAGGKPAADAAKACIESLVQPVNDVFLAHFKRA